MIGSELSPAPSPSRAPFLVACAAALIYILTFGTMGILQYQAGNVTYADSANLEEMLWRTLHGHFLAWSGAPYSLLGEHVEMIHLLLLPIYAIYPNLQTCMVAETVALGGSALLAYAIAATVLGRATVGLSDRVLSRATVGSSDRVLSCATVGLSDRVLSCATVGLSDRVLSCATVGLPDRAVGDTAGQASRGTGASRGTRVSRSTPGSRWAGAAFAVAWVLYTPLQMINLEGGGALHTFRPIAFSVPLVLAAFYFLIQGRRVAFSMAAFATLLVKEEFGLVLMMVGLYAALIRKERKLGLAWAAIGAAWFAVSLWVVIPYVGGRQSHVVGYYSNLGHSPGEIVATVFAHPVKTLEIALAPEKREFLAILFAPVAYFCLLSPLVMAMTLPSLAVCLLSGRYATSMPWFHYHTPIVPFVFIAAAYGIRNLLWAVRRLAPWAATGRAVTAGAAVLLLLSSLVTNVIYSKSPLSFRFYDPESGSCYKYLYVVTPHAREIPNVVRSIPSDARVSASLFLATRFTHHAAIYGFPQGLDPQATRPADYVVLDLQERWLFDLPEQREAWGRLVEGKEFERLPAPDGFAIFRRRPSE